MNKQEALDLFGFESEPSADDVQLRQIQLQAFFLEDSNSKIGPLAKPIASKIDKALEKLTQPQEKSESIPDSKAEQATEKAKDKTESASQNKSQAGGFVKFLFPEPFETAGAFLTDKWWRVYKRIVLLGLAFYWSRFCNRPRRLFPSLIRIDHPTAITMKNLNRIILTITGTRRSVLEM